MRIRLNRGGPARDVERPPGLPGPDGADRVEPVDVAWWRYSPDGATVTASIRFRTGRRPSGVGVWAVDDGTLGWWHWRAEDVHPLWASSTLLVDELLFGRGRLARYSWPELSLVDELPYSTGTSGLAVEELEISRSQRLALAWLNDGQGVNSYAVFGLDGPLRRLTAEVPRAYAPMSSLPVFSADERLVACAAGDVCWWQPSAEQWPDGLEQDWDTPSFGGPTEYATLVVHAIERGETTEHRIEMDLPAGWVPEDPDDGRWMYGPQALDFPAADLVRLWLPDGVRVDLRLPLPEVVRLTPPDTCTAPWTGTCSDPAGHRPHV